MSSALPATVPSPAQRVMASNKSLAAAITRESEVLNAFAYSPSAAMRLIELVRLIGISTESGYRLGRKIVELGRAYLHGFDEPRAYNKLCGRAEHPHKHGVQVGMLDYREVLSVARFEGRSQFQLAARVGSRPPSAQTAIESAVIFAGASFSNLTARSITTVPRLKKVFGHPPTDGNAVDVEGVHAGPEIDGRSRQHRTSVGRAAVARHGAIESRYALESLPHRTLLMHTTEKRKERQ